MYVGIGITVNYTYSTYISRHDFIYRIVFKNVFPSHVCFRLTINITFKLT